MRTHTRMLLVAAALLGTGVAPARGQNTAIDPRWLAYIGCWQPVEAGKSNLCVVPAPGASGGAGGAVDLLTIVKGQVTARERIAATGERSDSTPTECAWHSAEWSANGQRLFLRSEDTCSAGTTRGGTGVIAMSGNGQWLYIQAVTLGGQTGVRVQGYREAAADILLPDDIAAALRPGVSATMQARAAASAPLSIADVVEASHKVDTAVLEAWLVERAEPFTLDAKRLVVLADAGVPSRVIDLMVALSYPKVFAIDAASRQGERLAATRSSAAGTSSYDYPARYDLSCSGYSFLYPYSSYDCSGLGRGYGYGYGWYPDGYPVIIIYNPSSGGGGGGSTARPHGRVVNGQGYATGGDTGSGQARPRSDSWSPSSGSSAGSSSPSTSSTSSGSTEQRTAKPRPPQ